MFAVDFTACTLKCAEKEQMCFAIPIKESVDGCYTPETPVTPPLCSVVYVFKFITIVPSLVHVDCNSSLSTLTSEIKRSISGSFHNDFTLLVEISSILCGYVDRLR